MSDSVRPHRRQPTRFLCPWDSPGKNTGVGCHFLLQCMKEKSESEVTQSCPTPSDPMDWSPPGSSIHGFSRQEYWSFSFSTSPSSECCCCCQVASVVSDSVRSHRWQPTRLHHPWDSPGKNTGVGCHFLLQCMKVKRESEVAQSCPTPSDPMDCRPLRTWDFPGEYWNQYFAFICSFSSSMFFDKPTIALGDMKHSL